MNIFKYAFKVSRFRFWFYTGGPFVLGYVIGMKNWLAFFRPEFFIYLFYFIIPANIFIYGVNDYWDMDTDIDNPKKSKKEVRMTRERKKDLEKLIFFTTAFSLTLMIIQDNTLRLIFASFLLISYFYSAEPLRFKKRPIIDFLSNILYIMPAIFGLSLSSGNQLHLSPVTIFGISFIFSGVFHVSSMHIFSAIPDIEFDKKAGINTTAVVLGKRNALIITLFFWLLLSYWIITISGLFIPSFSAILFPAIPLMFLLNGKLDIDRVYWKLPIVNFIFGAGFISLILLSKPIL